MSLLGPTLVLYLVVGAGVAAAVYLTEPPRPGGERLLRLATALPFWPFYLPILLARPGSASRPLPDESSADELGRAIARAEAELDAALNGLDVTGEQRERVRELSAAWRGQAERVREMDHLLARPEYSSPGADADPAAGPRARQSLARWRENLERLRQVRERCEADLLASTAWVRELASRIHLARFTGGPAAGAEELLAEIGRAAEGLSAPPRSDGQAICIKKAE